MHHDCGVRDSIRIWSTSEARRRTTSSRSMPDFLRTIPKDTSSGTYHSIITSTSMHHECFTMLLETFYFCALRSEHHISTWSWLFRWLASRLHNRRKVVASFYWDLEDFTEGPSIGLGTPICGIVAVITLFDPSA